MSATRSSRRGRRGGSSRPGTGRSGRADLPAAAGLLQRAVDVDSDDDRTQLQAMFELARALIRRGELERADSYLLAAIEHARRGRRPRDPRAGTARPQLASRTASTPTRPSRTSSRRRSRSPPRSRDPTSSRRSLPRTREIGTCKFQLGRAGEGELDLERAAEIARELGRHRAPSRHDGSAAPTGGWGPMPRAEGVALCEELLVGRLCERRAQGAGAPDPRAVPGDARRRRGISSRGRGRVER